jgi:gamma-glutamyltranspeptidase/glutathione hydrolase
MPAVVRVEDRIDGEVRSELSARGHKVAVRTGWSEGRVLAVSLDRARGLLQGGCDPRGQAQPVMAAQVIGW